MIIRDNNGAIEINKNNEYKIERISAKTGRKYKKTYPLHHNNWGMYDHLSDQDYNDLRALIKAKAPNSKTDLSFDNYALKRATRCGSKALAKSLVNLMDTGEEE